jgi:hypothetical protein
MTKKSTFSDIITTISKFPSGYVVSGFSYAFPSKNKTLKPFLYLYYPKIHKQEIMPNNLYSIEQKTIDIFLKKSNLPIYTIVQDSSPIMNQYPNSLILFHTSNYNDVESYYSLDKNKIISDFSKQRNIYFIQLKK